MYRIWKLRGNSLLPSALSLRRLSASISGITTPPNPNSLFNHHAILALFVNGFFFFFLVADFESEKRIEAGKSGRFVHPSAIVHPNAVIGQVFLFLFFFAFCFFGWFVFGWCCLACCWRNRFTGRLRSVRGRSITGEEK